MASTIAQYAFAERPPNVFDPSNQVSLADQTTTTAVQTAVTACAWFRAMISLKTFTVSGGSRGPLFELQCSTDLAFTTAANITTVATAEGGLTTAVPSALILIGCSPIARKTYYRLKVTFSSSDSGTFDVILDACP